MEKKKATKVGCQACKNNNRLKNLQTTVFVSGGIFLILAIYGVVSLVKALINLF